MLRDAIAAYNDLLTDEVGRAAHAHLDDQQRRRGLFFGERPLCTVLRPRFLSTEAYGLLLARVRVLLRAFDTAYRAAMGDPAVRSQFGLFDWEEMLLQHPGALHAPSPVSRLDSFFDPETRDLWFTEYNGETPAASAYKDVLTEVFLGLPVMGRFLRRYYVRPLPVRHFLRPGMSSHRLGKRSKSNLNLATPSVADRKSSASQCFSGCGRP